MCCRTSSCRKWQLLSSQFTGQSQLRGSSITLICCSQMQAADQAEGQGMASHLKNVYSFNQSAFRGRQPLSPQLLQWTARPAAASLHMDMKTEPLMLLGLSRESCSHSRPSGCIDYNVCSSVDTARPHSLSWRYHEMPGVVCALRSQDAKPTASTLAGLYRGDKRADQLSRSRPARDFTSP